MFANAGASADRRLVGYFHWSSESVRRALYSNEFGREVQGLDTAAPLLASLEDIPDEQEPLHRMLYLEAKHFLADHNLNYTDRAGMAAGIEVRVPFLDLDLVHLATRIPSRYKQEGRVGKAILNEARNAAVLATRHHLPS
jgi:asparagine synthase (glutamine-hydrolysing)